MSVGSADAASPRTGTLTDMSIHPPVSTRQTLIRRIADRPVVDHGSVPGYGPVFNAGLLHRDGRYHLFARAIRNGYRRNTGAGPRFHEYVSDIVVFTSDDGHDYRYEYVLAAADGADIWSYEDPRVQVVTEHGHEHIVMTYTRLPHPDSGEPWRIGAHRLHYRDGRFHLDHPTGRHLGPEAIANKDAIIFSLADGRVALVHRIHPNMQVAVFESLADLWDAGDNYWSSHVAELDRHTIITPSPDGLGVGAGAPPVPTSEGLLLFFHERTGRGTYTMNVALLDPLTAAVRAVLPDPLMTPELHWEREGDVDDVVFVQGAHRRDDGSIYLTYGAADRCVGAAVVDEAELLAALVPVR
jgi:predicted GH43/DUF377 family glycosyl hydrolase